MELEKIFKSNKLQFTRIISFALTFIMLFNIHVFANSNFEDLNTVPPETVTASVYGGDQIDTGINILAEDFGTLEITSLGSVPVLVEESSSNTTLTISLHATGADGDIINVQNYQVPSGEVTIAGHTLNRHSAMGALVYYCQENSINVEITEGSFGKYVSQIGGNPDDTGNWMYYVNEASPWDSAANHILSNNDTVHFVNYILGRYSLSLAIDEDEIEAGESVTVTLTYIDSNGDQVTPEGADIYISTALDGYGSPASGASIGQTNADGKLTFTWSNAGTFYLYAEWNGKTSQYQWPVISFKVLETIEPVISTDTIITVGDINPNLEIYLSGDNFSIQAIDISNWKITLGSTGLIVNSIRRDEDQKITILFTGIAESGNISVKANSSALTGGSDSNEINIQLQVPSVSPELTELVSGVVNYYKNNKTNLTSWWELVALRGAGENLNDSLWTLPQWSSGEFPTSSSVTDYAGRIIGLLAVDQDPANWQGRNLATELISKQNGMDGSFGGINHHIYAMLALDAANASYDQNKAVNYLISKQLNNGGFSLSTTPDPDITGMALLVLGKHREKPGVETAITKAVTYLKGAQLDTGGFMSPFSSENSNSVSIVISGLTAVGENVTAEQWIKNGKSPLHALLSYQKGDKSFSFLPNGSTNQAATQQALIALGDLNAGQSVYSRLNTAQISNNANLSNLRFSTGSMNPVFSSGTYSYKLYIGSDIDNITLTPIKENANAAIKINGQTMNNSSITINNPQNNTIVIEVTAQNGNTKRTYTVEVVKATKVTASSSSTEPIEITNESVNIVVPSSVSSASIKINEVENNQATLPFIQVNTTTGIGSIELVFAEGTKITGPDNWDGTIHLPKLLSNNSVTVPNGTVHAVMEVGLSGGDLQFDQPVRLVIPGQAGKSAAFIKGSGSPVEITTVLNEDSQKAAYALPTGGIGKIDVSNDLVIWTKHFTRFITYIKASGGGSGGNPISDEIKVNVEIIGKNNRTHYSGYVTLPKSKANAFEALKATGVSYRARDNNSYIEEIAGEREDTSGSSTAGWKYKVGSFVPGDSAIDYPLQDGDYLLWFWAQDYTATAPGGAGLVPQGQISILKEIEQAIADAVKKLEEAMKSKSFMKSTAIENLEGQSLVIGRDKAMTESQKKVLQSLLKGNVVGITQKIEAGEESIVADLENEVILKISKDAVRNTVEITVKEIELDGKIVLPETHKLLSSLYEFGPKGTTFNKPVYMSIRTVIPEGLQQEDIVLAWYDEEKNKWIATATVVDASTGTVIGLVEHFTKFAVLVKASVEELQIEQEDMITVSFEDVNEKNYPWAVKEISYLASKGIISGVEGNRFDPAREITRAEFTTLLVKMMGLDPASEYQGQFKDVGKEDWYAGYIQAAVEAEIITGLGENRFGPSDKLTREQAAVMTAKLSGEKKAVRTMRFKDVAQISPWAINPVLQTANSGIFNGFPDETFRPKGYVTRAQSAVIIYKIMVE